jgi:hypothetical protein
MAGIYKLLIEVLAIQVTYRYPSAKLIFTGLVIEI